MPEAVAVPRRLADPSQAARHLLHNRDFVILWVGQLFSQIGDQCLLIAGITLVTQHTPSVLALLLPAVAMALPQILFGLVGGVMADRWNRKSVMIAADLSRALIVLSLLLIGSAGQLWILYLAAAALTMAGVFFYPARNAVIPNIVAPNLLLTANAFIQGSYMVALIVGPAVAALAVGLWSIRAAILFDSATFLISALASALTRVPPNGLHGRHEEARRAANIRAEMKEGLSFIVHNPGLRSALVLAAAATVGVASIVLLALNHLQYSLDSGATGYGVAMSTLGVSAMLGGLIVSRVSRRFSTGTLVGGMLIVTGGGIVLFAFAWNLAIVLVAVGIIGLCVVVARGALDTLAQALSPDAVRGRVQSAFNLIIAASTAIAQVLSASLGDLVGVRAVFVGAGVLTTLTGFTSLYVLRGVTHQLSTSAAHERGGQQRPEPCQQD